MLEYGARLEWFVTPHVAIGAGYAGTDIDTEFENGRDLGAVEYRFDGFRVNTTLAF